MVDVSSRHPPTLGTSEGASKHKFHKDVIDRKLAATYDDITALKMYPGSTILIDVRTHEEIQSSGSIPTSINIPFDELEEALDLSSEEFEKKYGCPHPTADTPLIFTSLSGGRAGDAAYLADQHGYRKVKCYVGSWEEYAEIKKKKRQLNRVLSLEK